VLCLHTRRPFRGTYSLFKLSDDRIGVPFSTRTLKLFYRFCVYHVGDELPPALSPTPILIVFLTPPSNKIKIYCFHISARDDGVKFENACFGEAIKHNSVIYEQMFRCQVSTRTSGAPNERTSKLTGSILNSGIRLHKFSRRTPRTPPANSWWLKLLPG
jgi:hypothetical protein